MRYFILVFLCALNFTASAQFWQSSPKPVRVDLAPIASHVYNDNIILTFTSPVVTTTELPKKHLQVMDIVEAALLRDAKHNMRFRIYDVASYNFADLAALYIQQNRFSEAKWYLLQSTTLSRKQNNNKLTLSNLLTLAKIKTELGEFALAKADLQEAHEIALAIGLNTDVADINKKINLLANTKPAAVKTETRYAEAVEIANAKPPVN